MAKETLEISKLVFELTLLSGSSTHLELMLGRLFAILGDFPSFPIKPHGAILLYNAKRKLVQVAEHGLREASMSGCTWQVLCSHPAPENFDPLVLSCECALAADSWGYGGECRLLVLPLRDDAKLIGYATLGLESEVTLSATQLGLLRDLGRTLSVLVGRAMLDEIVGVREWELEEAHTDAIHRLGSASEYRDNETGWHVMRMTNYALAIAKQMNLPEDQRELLFIAAPMHDVGKIGIPDAILLKPERLSAAEMDVMRGHAAIGETILKGHDALITAARDIAGAHHERWDGTGYPRALKGEEIPILARICAVADVLDALTSSRPYKEAWPFEEAQRWVMEQSGTQFDPSVVAAFAAALPEIQRVRELYRDDIIDPRQVLSLPPPVGRNESWVAWDASFSVGIDAIDEHHRHLFDIANELHEVVSKRRGGREVARLLKALDLYAQVHFRAEEMMMDHYSYPGALRQKHQHRVFHDRLREFHQELHVNPLTAQHDVLDFVRNWLVAHIRDEDTQLRVLALPSAPPRSSAAAA